MLSQYIKPSNRVEIELHSKLGTSKTYVSKVESVLNEQELLVYVPISYGVLVKLPLNRTCQFTFYGDIGIYEGDGIVLNYEENDEFTFMKVKILGELKKTQRREFFRLKCLIDFKFIKIDMDKDYSELDDEGDSFLGQLENGLIKDIGGGGIRFVSDVKLKREDIIQCIISLDSTYISALSEILYTKGIDESIYKYEYRTKFINLSLLDQEKIIQYIFNQQRQILRNSR